VGLLQNQVQETDACTNNPTSIRTRRCREMRRGIYKSRLLGTCLTNNARADLVMKSRDHPSCVDSVAELANTEGGSRHLNTTNLQKFIVKSEHKNASEDESMTPTLISV